MKKLLLASAIALGISSWTIALPAAKVEAQAKEYDMKPNLANAIKRGSFPFIKGKVGMTYAELKKIEKSKEEDVGEVYFYYTSKKYEDRYAFKMDYKRWKKNGYGAYKPLSTQKISYIEREYDYRISKKSVEKYFGKPYKGIPYEPTGKKQKWIETNIYKAGEYYFVFFSSGKSTYVSVATKESALILGGVKKIYR